jgi:excisionase family DNA binding protein
MKMTLGEAARHSGLNKSTISRAIKDGKLSAEKSDETNSYKIDVAELERYREAVRVARAIADQPRLPTDDNGVDATGEQRTATHSSNQENDAATLAATAYDHRLALIQEQAARKLAEARLADLKSQLENMKEVEGRTRADHRAELDELRRQRDQWQEQAQRAMLTFQGVQQQLAPPKAPERSKGLFSWLRKVG